MPSSNENRHGRSAVPDGVSLDPQMDGRHLVEVLVVVVAVVVRIRCMCFQNIVLIPPESRSASKQPLMRENPSRSVRGRNGRAADGGG